jgi:transcriptional regulator with XRE-family HTH domain
MANKFAVLRTGMKPASQARASQRTAEMMRDMPLQELRQARQFSQETLADALDTSQSSISKLERRVDVYVSTLRRYIQSMGGELDIVARFPEGSVRINQFEEIDTAAAASQRSRAKTGR